MSAVQQYSTLYPLMLLELPGAADRPEIMLQALQKSGHEFARFTESYIENLEPIPITEYQRDYTLSLPSNTAVQRILDIWVNSNIQDARWYELEDGIKLRFASNNVPADLDDTMIQCGAAGETDFSAWALLSDCSVTIPLSGTSYSIEDIDMDGVTDMHQVALKIQTALRTESENNEGFVEWWETNTRFVVYARSGEISALTAGASGTDISGALYMNGLAGAATVAPMLDVKLSLLPDISTDILPDWFLNRYQSFIVAGAMVDLASMTNQSWGNANTVAKYMAIWREGLSDGKMDISRRFSDGDLGLSA